MYNSICICKVLFHSDPSENSINKKTSLLARNYRLLHPRNENWQNCWANYLRGIPFVNEDDSIWIWFCHDWLVTFYFQEYYTHKQSYYWLSNSSLNVFDLLFPLFYLLVEASVYNGHSFIGKEKRSSRNVSTPKMSQYPPLRLVETEVAAIVNLTLLNKSNNAMFSACYGNIGCCIR